MTGHAPFAVLGYLCLAALCAGVLAVIYGFGALIGVL